MPSAFDPREASKYARFRRTVIQALPHLSHLDGTAVSDDERAQAAALTTVLTPAKAKAEKAKGRGEGGSGGAEGAFVVEQVDADAATAVEGGQGAQYGMQRFVYRGRQSEGNRFIRDEAL